MWQFGIWPQTAFHDITPVMSASTEHTPETRLRPPILSLLSATGHYDHDHCAKFLAHKQAEALALLGDTRALIA